MDVIQSVRPVLFLSAVKTLRSVDHKLGKSHCECLDYTEFTLFSEEILHCKSEACNMMKIVLMYKV